MNDVGFGPIIMGTIVVGALVLVFKRRPLMAVVALGVVASSGLLALAFSQLSHDDVALLIAIILLW